MGRAKEGSGALAAYFGEPPGDVKAEEIVRTLHAFCQSFAKAQARLPSNHSRHSNRGEKLFRMRTRARGQFPAAPWQADNAAAAAREKRQQDAAAAKAAAGGAR